jgi:hypothetical protein
MSFQQSDLVPVSRQQPGRGDSANASTHDDN